MKRPWTSFTAVLLAGLLSSGAAQAQAQAEVPTEEQWYGWQNLIGLGAAYSLVGVGLALDEDTEWIAAVGLGVYALSGPIIHLAHQRPTEGGMSLGLNVGLPLGGALLGVGIACGVGTCRGLRGPLKAAETAIILGAVGMLTANVIDVAVLSFEEVPVTTGVAQGALGAAPAQYRPVFQYSGRF
ncbi:hypothetical protein [Chondromyces apiculatus]|uniref:Uncharacterized protein n=1 Tax=Chondromyces apiculatus DSM 436 TaxID=1192034 RepID=A0A017T4M8_9BACT|nr:hypothetical protein [Chondromyces apiculatus]EYF03516.1 Hypothetical protein CAP_5500 [Chondromyces apiculatus DSM 436]